MAHAALQWRTPRLRSLPFFWPVPWQVLCAFAQLNEDKRTVQYRRAFDLLCGSARSGASAHAVAQARCLAPGAATSSSGNPGTKRHEPVALASFRTWITT